MLGVSVTLALLANGRFTHRSGFPWTLVKQRAAALAIRSTRIVLTAALGPFHFRMIRTCGSVSVADALSSDGNVFDGVK